MEGLKNNPTSLLDAYVDEFKINLFNEHTTSKKREEFLAKFIAEQEWYLRMRKMAESQDSQELENFMTELEKPWRKEGEDETKNVEKKRGIDRYKIMEKSFGWIDGQPDPKFTILDLEEFLIKIKNLSLPDDRINKIINAT